MKKTHKQKTIERNNEMIRLQARILTFKNKHKFDLELDQLTALNSAFNTLNEAFPPEN